MRKLNPIVRHESHKATLHKLTLQVHWYSKKKKRKKLFVRSFFFFFYICNDYALVQGTKRKNSPFRKKGITVSFLCEWLIGLGRAEEWRCLGSESPWIFLRSLSAILTWFAHRTDSWINGGGLLIPSSRFLRKTRKRIWEEPLRKGGIRFLTFFLKF